MPVVTGVRLRYSKTLWFSPGELTPVEGDIVIVETERGQEVGLVQHGPHEVEESALKAPLKPVIRIATDEDITYISELNEKEKAAMPKFKELIERNKLDMKPVDIEYLFSGDKIVFYFSAEERVDFRSLVKDLASYFHSRIDMRQVGVRDEARMVGGLGHCGEVLCCARLGGEFAPVSIKMAKDQGLPLNPLKISGRCGRLMCCLRYEVEAYKDFNERSPRKNALVETPRGEGKVVEIDALREIITLQFRNEDESFEKLSVPLCKMHCEKEGKKCNCSIDAETFEELTETKEHAADPFLFPTPHFKTLDDSRPAAPGASEEKTRTDERSERDSDASKPKNGRRRRRGGKGRNKGGQGESSGQATAQNSEGRAAQSSRATSGEQSGQASARKRRKRSDKARGTNDGQQQARTRGENSQQRSTRNANKSTGGNGERRGAKNAQNSGGKSADGAQDSAYRSRPGERVPRRRNRS